MRYTAPTLVEGSDGLPVSRVDSWAEEKLYYIERYATIFSRGMYKKWDRLVYVDLFSGPGRSVVAATGSEIDGSALRPITQRLPFTHYYFNDASAEAYAALSARIPAVMRPNVVLRNLNANEAAREVGDIYYPRNVRTPRTLVLAVVDPYGFDIEFASLAHMTQGSRPVDLIVTVMTGYLRRFIGEPSLEARLDPFFGSPGWRQLVDLRAAGHRVTFRALLDFYERQFRPLRYRHVDDDIRILNSSNATIYHLMFASKHPLGHEFLKRISRKKFGGQQTLL